MNTPVTVTGNNQNAPTDPIFTANLVWEGFTTNGCSDLTVSYCGTTPNFQGGLVYLATGCPLTNLVFNSAANIIPNICGDGNFGILFPGLPAGTYYYPVLEAPGSSGEYTLVFTAEPCDAAPPANAFCSGAMPLAASTSCDVVSGSVENATAANNLGTACGNGNVSDGVWYSFVATSASTEITVEPSAEFNVHLSLVSGDCATQSLLACAIGQNFGTTTILSATGLVVGSTYYLRVADWYAGVPRTSTFDICVVALTDSECEAAAGNLIPDMANVCYSGPSTTVVATPSGTAIVPSGFSTKFLLVSSSEVVLQMSDQPSFSSVNVGGFSIRSLVYDPLTYDPGTLTFGQSTIGSLNELFVQGGGGICASLDITGAAFTVENCCTAAAGSLTAAQASICWEEPQVSIAAEPGGDAVVPAGSVVRYLLVRNPDSIVVDTASSPLFLADAPGIYTIFGIVYDTLTYSLDTLELDTTTILEVTSVFTSGGGSLCGSVDTQGAVIDVVRCCPGALGQLVLANDTQCFDAEGVTFTWEVQGADMPEGYVMTYLINGGNGAGLDTITTPVLTVLQIGVATIHQLVYDTLTLDLDTVIGAAGTISGLQAFLVQGGGIVCALLDTAGASVAVVDCSPANDDCEAPQVVPVQVVQDCAAGLVQGDNTYATQGAVTAPSCGDLGSTYADVWYIVNSGENTGITINLDPGAMTAWGIVVQEACDGTELLCAAQPGAPIDLDVQPGSQLLIRVFTDLALGEPGVFAICVTGAVPSTICDGGSVAAPDDAVLLTVCQDGFTDEVEFTTTSVAPVIYTYVVTDMDSAIVAVLAGDSFDLNELTVGTYLVHGVSHDGTLTGTSIGEPLGGLTTTGQCLAGSSNAVEVRVEVCSGISDPSSGGWSIGPIPNNGRFSIAGAQVQGSLTVQVISWDGRLVYEQVEVMRPNSQLLVELPSNSASGLYMVRLLADGELGVARRMIVH